MRENAARVNMHQQGLARVSLAARGGVRTVWMRERQAMTVLVVVKESTPRALAPSRVLIA